MWIVTAFFAFAAVAWLPLKEAYPAFAEWISPERFVALAAICLVTYLLRKQKRVSSPPPESVSAPLVRLHVLEGDARKFAEKAATVTRLGNELLDPARHQKSQFLLEFGERPVIAKELFPLHHIYLWTGEDIQGALAAVTRCRTLAAHFSTAVSADHPLAESVLGEMSNEPEVCAALARLAAKAPEANP